MRPGPARHLAARSAPIVRRAPRSAENQFCGQGRIYRSVGLRPPHRCASRPPGPEPSALPLAIPRSARRRQIAALAAQGAALRLRHAHDDLPRHPLGSRALRRPPAAIWWERGRPGAERPAWPTSAPGRRLGSGRPWRPLAHNPSVAWSATSPGRRVCIRERFGRAVGARPAGRLNPAGAPFGLRLRRRG
jgi:hypothetical protein